MNHDQWEEWTFFFLLFSALFHFLKESSRCFTLPFLLYVGDVLVGNGGAGQKKWSREGWQMKHESSHAARVLFCLWSGEVFVLSWRETHVHTPRNPHAWTPSSEKPVTGNWLGHRNLLTSFVTVGRLLPLSHHAHSTQSLGLEGLPARRWHF